MTVYAVLGWETEARGDVESALRAVAEPTGADWPKSHQDLWGRSWGPLPVLWESENKQGLKSLAMDL